MSMFINPGFEIKHLNIDIKMWYNHLNLAIRQVPKVFSHPRVIIMKLIINMVLPSHANSQVPYIFCCARSSTVIMNLFIHKVLSSQQCKLTCSLRHHLHRIFHDKQWTSDLPCNWYKIELKSFVVICVHLFP